MSSALSFAWAPGPYVAVLATALVLAWSVFERRQQRRSLRRLGARLTADSPLMAMLASASPARHYTRRALLAGALGACILAGSRPQVPGYSRSEQIGIDLVVAVDHSASMLADDVYPDRLTASKRALEKLLDRSPGDRVGLVVFAGAAAHYPLTHDRQAIRSMFRGLEVQDLPPGSNLAEAIRVARCLARPGRRDDPDCNGVGGRGRGGAPLDDSTAGAVRVSARDDSQRGRALIVFTDGEETADDAREELALATRLGIDVYLVAVGTEDGARVPDIDPRGYRLGWKKRADGSEIESQLDRAKLAELAAIAGGPHRLFAIGGPDSGPGRPIAELPRSLDTLQRGVWRAQSVLRQRNVYEWFLFPGFILLIVEASVSARRRTVAQSSVDRA